MTYHSRGMQTTEINVAPQMSHSFSPVSSSNFSTLSSSQILFSGKKIMLVVVDTSEMIDQDEEVALKFSIWIGGNN